MKALRRRDRRTPVPGSERRTLDGAVFEGSWVNTAADTRGLERLLIRRRGPSLEIRSFDPKGDRVDWRPEDVRLLSRGPASSETTAFSASVDLGEERGLLQGSLNLGLLVLAVYRVPRAPRIGYFSREFFLRIDPPPPGDTRSPRGRRAETLFPEIGTEIDVDTAAFDGLWQNADPGSPGIARIRVEIDEDTAPGAPTVEAASAPEAGDGEGAETPLGWGIGPTRVFATVDESGARSACLLATYDLGFLTSELQLRVSGGALVLANFNRFRDRSGRFDYFTREFYHRG